MNQFPQLTEKTKDDISVIMQTTKGDIHLRLFPEYAPKAVENFLTLAEQGYYNGIIFHRVINDFMIQGGDPTGTGMGGESMWGEPFEDEFSMNVFNLNGALSMANAGPGTNGSQFFIVTNRSVAPSMLGQLEAGGWPEEIIAEYEKNGGTPWLDHRHTVFGQVTEGMDVVYAIEQVEKGANDKPVEDVVILGIEKVTE